MLRKARAFYWKDHEHTEFEDLYHDCWIKIEQAKFIQNIPAFIWTTYINHIRNTRRNYHTSSDALDHITGSDMDTNVPEQVDLGLKDAVCNEVGDWRVQHALETIGDDIAYIGWQAYAMQRTAEDLAIELDMHPSAVYRRMTQFKNQFMKAYLAVKEDEPSWAHFP